jgi:phosphoribosylanthranilate isomerase
MTKIKICGITNPQDALLAAEAGADFLGFILYARSPRFVAVAAIRQISDAVRGACGATGRPRLVGVFVNEAPPAVAAALADGGLDYAQLHGEEAEADVAALSGRAFKALRPANAADALAGAERYWPLSDGLGPRLLIDALAPGGAYGGTGHQADWEAAAAVAQRYPGLLLAGGLTPANVGTAVATVRPWGVDVSSGVELAPGRKDAGQVRALIAAVRALPFD